MAKTTLVTKKKRGPPATGQGLQVGERWHPPEIAAIDAWIKTEGGNLTRGHAIRRLVAIGLKCPTNTPKKKGRPDKIMKDSDGRVIPPKPRMPPAVELGLKAPTPTELVRSTSNKLRATELAAKAIEKMIAPSASADERVQRRRRLTKGPPEFREDRLDLLKRKS
jgi:hypothetical protein